MVRRAPRRPRAIGKTREWHGGEWLVATAWEHIITTCHYLYLRFCGTQAVMLLGQVENAVKDLEVIMRKGKDL